MLIALDPGHGGRDPGAVGNGLMEKDITLKLALRAGTYLRTHYDCDVMYTRNSDVYLSPSERANIVNKIKADYFCSIHINSFTAVTAKGFETFRYAKDEKSMKLQRNVHEEVMKVLTANGIVDRGTKAANFAVLRLYQIQMKPSF